MNNRLQDKTKILRKVGSFWTNNTSRDNDQGLPLVRAITRLIEEDGARGRQQETEDILLGSSSHRYNFTLTFYKDEVTPIGADTGEVTLNDGTFELLSNGVPLSALSRTGTNSAHYLIKIPEGTYPVSIQTPRGMLTAGLGFTAGEGWLRVFSSPHVLFPEDLIHVKCAKVQHCSIHDYTMRVDSTDSGLYYLSRYYRLQHSAAALELALNEVAGRQIIKSDCVVTNVQFIEFLNRYVYTMSDSSIYKVGYEHNVLSVGDTCYKDQIIGRAIEVYAKPSTNAASWWTPHFSGTARGNTLNIQDLNPALPAVEVPNSDVRFWAYEAVDATFHVRAEFTGSAGDLDIYFDIVKSAELWTGEHWNEVFGFTVLDEEDAAVNGLDFMFTNVLSSRAIIVDIDTKLLGTSLADKIAYVARRELPLGCVPIIRKWSSS